MAWIEASMTIFAAGGKTQRGWEKVRHKWRDISCAARKYHTNRVGKNVTGGGPQPRKNIEFEAVLDAMPDEVRDGIFPAGETESIPKTSLSSSAPSSAPQSFAKQIQTPLSSSAPQSVAKQSQDTATYSYRKIIPPNSLSTSNGKRSKKSQKNKKKVAYLVEDSSTGLSQTDYEFSQTEDHEFQKDTANSNTIPSSSLNTRNGKSSKKSKKSTTKKPVVEDGNSSTDLSQIDPEFEKIRKRERNRKKRQCATKTTKTNVDLLHLNTEMCSNDVKRLKIEERRLAIEEQRLGIEAKRLQVEEELVDLARAYFNKAPVTILPVDVFQTTQLDMM